MSKETKENKTTAVGAVGVEGFPLQLWREFKASAALNGVRLADELVAAIRSYLANK